MTRPATAATSSVSTTSVRRGFRQRVQSETGARHEREASLGTADEAREVEAGDVLDDLSARVRDRPVGEDERHSEDQVAWRSEAMPQRARDVAREERADRRIARWVEGEALAARGEPRPQSREPEACLDRARQVSGVVLEDAAQPVRREVVADAYPAALHVSCRQSAGRLLEARDARQRRSSRAGGRGTGRAPLRRAAASGSPCPGCRCPWGRRRGGAARRRGGRARRTCAASSTPCPSRCRARPSATRLRRGRRRGSPRRAHAHARSRLLPRRRGRADGGCRRRRGTRCRRGGRGRARAPRSGGGRPEAAFAGRRRPGRSSRSRRVPSRRTPTCGPSRGAHGLHRSSRARISNAPLSVQMRSISAASSSTCSTTPSSSTSSTAPGPGRVPGGDRQLGSLDRERVHHLDCGRHHARGDDAGDGGAGRVHRVEAGQESAHGLRRADDPERDPRGDPERAFGADDHPEQVGAVRVESRAAELDDFAVRQHEGQPGDVVRREAVLQAVRAARVLGDVAADRAHLLARRVGRVEEAVARRRRASRRGSRRRARRRRAGLRGRSRGCGPCARARRRPRRRAGVAPPESPVPAPRATNGTRSR